MNREEITRLAMRDAGTEMLENLEPAAAILDHLTASQPPAIMLQDDITGTPLPNGMLHWFGFDFERVDLPGAPVLKHGEPPIWVGSLPGFTCRTGVADARVVISADQFQPDRDDDDAAYAAPREYSVAVTAHGFDRDEVFSCPDWHEVQQRCRRLEQRLDESQAERHAHCLDEQGGVSENACAFCELGQTGG